MDTQEVSDLHKLRILMKNLPEALPLHSQDDTYHPALFNWSIDDGWAQDVGKDGAINRALEAAIGPRKSGGIFPILERGPAMENLAKILDTYSKELPDSFLINNWIQNAIASAESVLKEHRTALPDFTQSESENAQAAVSLRASVPPQDADPGNARSSNGPKETTAVIQARKKGKSKPTKRDTKAMTEADIADDRYRDQPEKTDNRKGGRQAMPLLAKITRIKRKTVTMEDAIPGENDWNSFIP
ncbi:hypothetical protein AAF712_012835 [Marasmius tenuissimus]|uniref:Uncharacterized protein n=1 Tax=Marasmius tenuissimus TaxID=585030 RepID=A0ABR2ZHD4_9AGAR